jgi:transcriptional regulator with XRE-family HTH domain
MNSDQKLEVRQDGQGSKVNPDLVERLKLAVRLGGGNKVVAAKSGVKLSTLNNYLRSVARIPAQAATKIATACNVRIDWLLNGEGSMELPTLLACSPPTQAFSQSQRQIQTSAATEKRPALLASRPYHDNNLRWTPPEAVINIDRLGAAIEMAEEADPNLAVIRLDGPIPSSLASMHAFNVLQLYNRLTREAADTGSQLQSPSLEKDA